MCKRLVENVTQVKQLGFGDVTQTSFTKKSFFTIQI